MCEVFLKVLRITDTTPVLPVEPLRFALNFIANTMPITLFERLRTKSVEPIHMTTPAERERLFPKPNSRYSSFTPRTC